MGRRGAWRQALGVAAVAACLSGCASADYSDSAGPATYQTQAPQQASPSEQIAQTEPPITATIPEQPPPYKPVLKAAPAPLSPGMAPQTQTQDVAALIQASRSAYPGNCACPYDRDRAGRKCGGRSAYSRTGGYSVLCYPSDVKGSSLATQSNTYAVNVPPPAISGGCGALVTAPRAASPVCQKQLMSAATTGRTEPTCDRTIDRRATDYRRFRLTLIGPTPPRDGDENERRTTFA